MKRFVCFAFNHLSSFFEIFRGPVLWAFSLFIILNVADPPQSLLSLYSFISFLSGALFGVDMAYFLLLYLDEQKKLKSTCDL